MATAPVVAADTMSAERRHSEEAAEAEDEEEEEEEEDGESSSSKWTVQDGKVALREEEEEDEDGESSSELSLQRGNTVARPSVCVLGLGSMGMAMARRLRGEGFSISVWNRSPAKCELLAAEEAPGNCISASTAACRHAAGPRQL